VKIDVYRVGDQTPTEVARAVGAYVERAGAGLPAGVGLTTWDDQSEIFADRIGLLLRNGALGLILVFFVLGAFLELRLAFWVMLGIAISLLGSFIVFPVFGVSINMISLFAFIITLGIVVDDAIIVGENTYYKRQQGIHPLPAAIEGAREVGKPVVFAVLTSVVAFSPMLFVPGFAGKIFRVIPIIVISVLTLSLVESLFILPAHLAHSKPEEAQGLWATLRRPQKMVSDWFEWFVENIYQEHVQKAIRYRYITIGGAVALLLAALGIMIGGHLPFVFMPDIESAIVAASVRLPVEAPMAEARRIRDRFVAEGQAAAEKLEEEEGGKVLRGIYAQIGSTMGAGGPASGLTTGETGAHIIEVAMQLVAPDDRRVTTPEVADRWRQAVGRPTGVRTMAFNYSTGPGAGADITIQLQHPDTRTLERAASTLAQRMEEYAGVINVDPGFAGGKPQLDLTLKPVARAMGLTEAGMARQIRSALFGAEALRQQRGRYEMRVMVRLPEEDRDRMFGLEQFRLRTPEGGELPLIQAADITETSSNTSINRVNGRRVLNVSADTEETAVTRRILDRIEKEELRDLEGQYADLSHEVVGQQEDLQESVSSLMSGFAGALIVIYALLAIPFRSYVQPVIVMTAIPFGFIGAIAGHLLLGYKLSLISLMGLVALAGVVVNDSLLLIVRANEAREGGSTVHEAVVEGGMRRFRPIILTSLTTFFGLAPLIFEGSVQARYLIPMAISLGFGILFATSIVLILVPSIFMVVEDLRGLLSREHQTPGQERRQARHEAGSGTGTS
ncbi:MAG: efflux RND transporter permease subunit, partial [Gemmatimonadota bacterium]